MDLSAIALWLATRGTELIAKGLDLWVAQGKSPDEFDAAVTASRLARESEIRAQRNAELKVLGDK